MYNYHILQRTLIYFKYIKIFSLLYTHYFVAPGHDQSEVPVSILAYVAKSHMRPHDFRSCVPRAILWPSRDPVTKT